MNFIYNQTKKHSQLCFFIYMYKRGRLFFIKSHYIISNGHQSSTNKLKEMIKISDENAGNYAKTRGDEELREGVTYLPMRETGLSKDIIVDTGETYIWCKHELCLYVVKGDNVYPVLISDSPTSPTGNEVPEDIATFIRDNVVILTQVADMEIDGGRFF